jgi:hypothetical protein
MFHELVALLLIVLGFLAVLFSLEKGGNYLLKKVRKAIKTHNL